jgi:hypothetical protein
VGVGLGASHQTGWTALVANLLARKAAGLSPEAAHAEAAGAAPAPAPAPTVSPPTPRRT